MEIIPQKTNFIYALVDPRTNEVRYVGVTCRKLQARLNAHFKSARNNSTLPVHYWLRALFAIGLEPKCVVIEETCDRERECYWIKHYREITPKLLNCTSGGDGVVNPSIETRRKMSASHIGHRHTAEARQKISEASKRCHTEEAKAKMRGPKTEAHRAKCVAHLRKLKAEGKCPSISGENSIWNRYPEKILRGEQNANAKLTAQDVRDMRNRYANGEANTNQLAVEHGVSQATTWRIIRRLAWKHVD